MSIIFKNREIYNTKNENGLLPSRYSRIHISGKFFLISLLSCILFGCSTNPKTVNQNGYKIDNETYHFEFSKDNSKDIFVFFDGTDNTLGSKTNIGLLYAHLTDVKNRNIAAIYMPGVGSLMQKPITGKLLGRGMEDRILIGHSFLSQNFNLGDRVHIFGFSRGAHQARALAGFVSYAGLLQNNSKLSESLINSERLIEKLKKQIEDDEALDFWRQWKPDTMPPLNDLVQKVSGSPPVLAGIDFLGVWDTVPGSSLKTYENCREKRGMVKKSKITAVIPGVDKGHRYKVHTYPTISFIAHAVSIDENRSKFIPLLICPELNPEYTTVKEHWFPGAHADVGGGYDDSDRKLSDISLQWMFKTFNSKFNIFESELITNPAPDGLAHWPIGDPSGLGSTCKDRIIPLNAIYDPSHETRKDKAPVEIRWHGNIISKKYPLTCADK